MILLSNDYERSFTGWIRVPIDDASNIPYFGTFDKAGFQYAMVRYGSRRWSLDIEAKMLPGERKTLDLGSVTVRDPVAPQIPVNPVAHFGGPLAIDGVPMNVVSYEVNGAGVDIYCLLKHQGVTWRAWLTWYPGDGHAIGEIAAIYSDPTKPDMASGASHRITFGDSVCLMPGYGFRNQLVPEGDWLADGQGRAVPVVFAWLRLGANLESVAALGDLRVNGNGYMSKGRDWLGRLPENFDAKAWARGLHGEGLRRLHSWDWALIGPAAKSGVTGAQEEQGFTRGEPQHDPCAIAPIYAAALKMAERPCHHCEADGTQLDAEAHNNPRLIYWDMRPHWHTGVSPERLGKTGDLNYDTTAHGRAGCDVEHWLIRTLAAGALYKHSRAAQYLLRQHGLNYLRQWTKEPGWSTSQPYASRAMGWEAQSMVLFDEALDDSVLRARLLTHWSDRMDFITGPWIQGRKYWDIRVNDPRLGPGEWWMPWQQAVGSYWMDVAGERFGKKALREACLHGAKVIVDEAWQEVAPDMHWEPRPIASVLGGSPTDPSFTYYGMALAPATVLRHEPTNERALRLWNYLVANARDAGAMKWLAPEVKP